MKKKFKLVSVFLLLTVLVIASVQLMSRPANSCQWKCYGDSEWGGCDPPDAETCLQECDSACGGGYTCVYTE